MGIKLISLGVSALVLSTSVNAATLVEDFEGAFPGWETGWLGVNSNVQNYYGVGGVRGNNPDGLWIADGLANGRVAEITFDAIFGASISDFSIDTTTHFISNLTFEVFDMDSNSIFNSAIAVTSGALTDPGTYQTFAFSSANGVSGFSITGGSAEGNTSIDNVIVNASVVPVPAAVWLFGSGLIGLVGFARRKKA